MVTSQLFYLLQTNGLEDHAVFIAKAGKAVNSNENQFKMFEAQNK